MKMKSWQELFPNGRQIFYEGDDPSTFVSEMRSKFNFDPTLNNPCWNEAHGFSFHLPGHLMDKVYGHLDYPLGS